MAFWHTSAIVFGYIHFFAALIYIQNLSYYDRIPPFCTVFRCEFYI